MRSIFTRGRAKRACLLSAAACAALAAPASADFIPGHLIVVSLNGADATSDAQAVSLLDYDLTGLTHTTGVTFSSTGGVAGGAALTLGGDADNFHDGHLAFSADGRYLLLGGYRANAGDTNPINSTNTVAPRVIGRVDSSWNANTSTSLNDAYNGGEIDAVASVDGNSFYVGGDNKSVPATGGGVRYVPSLGATSTTNLSQTQTTGGALEPDSVRNIKIYTDAAHNIASAQVYITTPAQKSFIFRGLFQTPTPLPTTGAQAFAPIITNDPARGQELIADASGSWVPKTDFVYADLSPAIAGYDTIFATGGKDEFQKYSLGTDGNWHQVAVYTLYLGPVAAGVKGPDIHALDLFTTGADVTLFAATTDGIYRFTDVGGYTDPAFPTGFVNLSDVPFYITADPGTQFRGIAYVNAVPEPASLGLLCVGALLALRRRNRRA